MIFLKCKCSHVSLLRKNLPWVPSSLRIMSRFLNLEIQGHSQPISSSQMQPHLSPLPLPPILQALSTLSPDLHILLSLWTFGVPSTQIALPPTHIVREMIISYQPKELAREAATCPPPRPPLPRPHRFLGTLLPASGRL